MSRRRKITLGVPDRWAARKFAARAAGEAVVPADRREGPAWSGPRSQASCHGRRIHPGPAGFVSGTTSTRSD